LGIGSSLSGNQRISLGGNLISNLGNDRIDNRRRCRGRAGIHGKRRSRRNRFNGARQHHETGAAIGTVGAAAGIQTGSSLLEELIQAVAIVDCADDAVDFGAAGQDGIVQGVQGIGGQEFVVKGNSLQPLDLFQAAINQHQFDVCIFGRFNNLTRFNQVAFVNLAHFALGVGGCDFPLDIGCFCDGSGFGHDDLPEKIIE